MNKCTQGAEEWVPLLSIVSALAPEYGTHPSCDGLYALLAPRLKCFVDAC